MYKSDSNELCVRNKLCSIRKHIMKHEIIASAQVNNSSSIISSSVIVPDEHHQEQHKQHSYPQHLQLSHLDAVAANSLPLPLYPAPLGRRLNWTFRDKIGAVANVSLGVSVNLSIVRVL